MSAVTQRIRLQAISLAIMLVIIDQTQGFTLRYDFVRPHDLTAAESSIPEVRHELKRNIDHNDDKYRVAPIAVAMPLIMTTEATVDNETGIIKKDSIIDWLETTFRMTTEAYVDKEAGVIKKETIIDLLETTFTMTTEAPVDTEARIIENETTIDRLKTTVTPNYLNAINAEDVMGSSSNIEEVRVFRLQEPERLNNTTSTSKIQEEYPTVVSSSGVTDNYVEESENVATNTSKDTENSISQKHDNTTTESPNNGGTLTELPNSEDITTESSYTHIETTPSWKRYTKIERKPVNISEETVLPFNTERVRDSLNAHTTESRVSLEKAFDLAPDILSLQELKNHLMDTTNAIPTTDLLDIADIPKGNMLSQTTEINPKEESQTTEINLKEESNTREISPKEELKTTGISPKEESKTTDISPEKESETTEINPKVESKTRNINLKEESKTTDVNPTEESKPTKINPKEESKTTEINPTEMVSKRAGYLDHTKPLIDAVVTTTVNTSATGNEIEVESVNAAYDMDAHDENEDTQNMTSHSQMVEDAMKEEFLKEARLVDSIPYYPTTANDKVNDELNEITPSPSGQVDHVANKKTPEDLTVRPINHDKKNNLYTVSPNYKPLKKIEVQPSKPFMRDPDDNSWRNESLSSLGIVFKGKNSSKAFTEVLKNKTETVMSNLQEPEKVLEKVELRDRLEKIAEKRKSRKKKIDKFGNTEYGDYEENNSGDMHSSKEKPSGASEVLMTSTSPTATKESTTKVSVTLFSIKPKTDKPKLALQEDYDEKEDYTDYMSFPNIDILKSTPRPRVQWPVTQKMLDNTQPTRHYLPDRQPTVQYFPPRPKVPATNNNNHDDDFKRKFPFYGHTSQLQNEPIETYEYSQKNEKNHGTYRTEKYVTDDISRNPIENKSPAIQHVEYRPVGATDDGSFSIRHYKDLLESVIKDTDYDRNGPYQPTPVIADEGKAVKSEEYDYGQRKEGLNRFVDYFNQNHERFKADFPVLFNTSVVHGSESGKVLASSSAMFKRLYNGAQPGQREAFAFSNKPFDPNCENITVELAPAYELHYFVPEQEETEDHTLPYGYRT